VLPCTDGTLLGCLQGFHHCRAAGTLPAELRALAADAAASAAVTASDAEHVLACSAGSPAAQPAAVQDPEQEQLREQTAASGVRVDRAHLDAAVSALKRRTATDVRALLL